MGASLVVQALMHRDLPHRTMRALVFMAVTAHDQDSRDVPAAHYFGGWVPIAEALGLADPRGRSAERVVARVMAELIAQGLCKTLGSSGGGRGRQVYVLTL
jgi:hypothetical protein